jgi:hypothetical protein
LPLAAAGLLLSVLGSVAPSGAADATPAERGPTAHAAHAAISPRPCPKVLEPSVPPPAFAKPGQPDGVTRAASARLARTCDPPDFLVPDDPAPRRTSTRRTGARNGAEPQWRPQRQQPGRKRAAPQRAADERPAPNRPAAVRPASAPGRAGGYAAGVLPGAGSPLGLTYGRSLLYSGGLGLLLTAVGVAMVGRRRRGW